MAVEAPPSIDLGCEFADFFCMSSEGAANFGLSIVVWLTDNVLGGQKFQPGTSLWATAIEQTNVWLGLCIMVMIITTIIALGAGMILARPDLIKRTAIGTFLSVPTTMFAYFAVGEGLRFVDEVSEGMLAKLTSDGSGFSGFIESISKQFQVGANGTLPGNILGGLTLVTGGNLAGPVVTVVFILAAGVSLIGITMAFRNLVLVILIAFAPLAFVLLPSKGGEVWVMRWVTAVVAMLLAKPLTYGVLLLVLAIFKPGETSVFSFDGLVGLIGLLVAAFMPMVAYSFFSFIGGAGADAAGSQAAQKLKMTGQTVNRTVQNFGRGFPGGGRGSTHTPHTAAQQPLMKNYKPTAERPQQGPQSGGGSTQPQVPQLRPGAGAGSRGTFDAKPAPAPPKTGR